MTVGGDCSVKVYDDGVIESLTSMSGRSFAGGAMA
jgi:hypothetical protein